MYSFLKRALDLLVAIVALIVFSPILLLFALAVKFDGTKGPVFVDIGTRIGKGRKPFYMYKFRSMVPGAHVDFWENHPELKEVEKEWKKIGKLHIDKDPRITKVGRIIRKTDLDELPQLFNVLKGEMSIVGPRAPYPEELDRYIAEFPDTEKDVNVAYSVKPGLTGVWQVSGRNSITIPARYKMEADYARRRNILEDIKIIIQTPIVMITRRGAVE
ncbi:sugar transferase [Candidatus Dojkabacteria bacterium]|nr:sugar transferase [Candidatus Dojkabacteria bacterium]